MEFIADLHIHSYLSRATAKNLNLENLNLWAQLKGITVVATGDFTHPQWFAELSEKLEPAEDGLFRLKSTYASETAPLVPTSCRGPVRFILSAEISSIYKKDGKTRKVHNVLLAPTLHVVEKINRELSKIGNVVSDGRPILGLDSKRLLEIVLEVSDDVSLIPAHIWTPWFSVLGSKSGFDSIEECFEELTPQIFAVETGLSSDPAMNRRVSSLDGLTLISNSDAHSPGNIGREANLFDTDLSYFAIREALKSGDPGRFLGTLEYFAEEGKYHFDGHRKCGVRLSPRETAKHRGLCPVCGRPVTIGVMYRVQELADREPGEKPPRALPYSSLLPLTDVLGEVFQVGVKSKKVSNAFRQIVERFGPEFEILRKIPVEAFEKEGPPLLSEAIRRMRNNQVHIAPGYDGEFGTISLFDKEERLRLSGQKSLFKASPKPPKRTPETLEQKSFSLPGARPLPGKTRVAGKSDPVRSLNKAQRKAVEHPGRALLIVAGPGTGKTFTLARRIAYLLDRGHARPEQVLAVTFTNKAAQEMTGRLRGIVGGNRLVQDLTVKTFHSLCHDIVSREAHSLGIDSPLSILSKRDRPRMVKAAVKRASSPGGRLRVDADAVSETISRVKQLLLQPEDELAGAVPGPLLESFPEMYRAYEETLRESRLLDFDDLILRTVKLLETDGRILKTYHERFYFIFIDEYQDINFAQYRLVRLLAPQNHSICVIGDPDQAIYGFRGADVRYFERFCEDYPDAVTVQLHQNYRSTETILQASGQLIRSGEKTPAGIALWSGLGGAKTLTVTKLSSERAEAEHIAKTIDQDVGGISHFSLDSGRVQQSGKGGERGFSDFAVLFRIKEQGKALEEAFRRSGIPFQTAGHEKLMDRRGIGEIVSYLKVLESVANDLDVERILVFPKRGIGSSTLQALKNSCEMSRCSLLNGLERLDDMAELKPVSKRKLGLFYDDLKRVRRRQDGLSVYEQLRLILDEFGIMDSMDEEKAFKEDMAALLDFSVPFENRGNDFLIHIALEQSQDRYDRLAEKVSLMTMHAAKGLEFPVVFIAGCEDGIVPYRRKKGDKGDLDEERRLFYVAMTRAREKIYLSHAGRRLWFGRRTDRQASPFLGAIEENLKEHREPSSGGRRPTKSKGQQLALFD
jgi:DNA helicase-2/ATP-dependent DNA helicase PcrA